MRFLKSKYAKILFWICITGYIFIMTTPNLEKLKGIEEMNGRNEVYKVASEKVMDIMSTKETDIAILQVKIDEIRTSLEELKKSENYDENLQNTINTWSSETDKVQSSLIVELDARIDELSELKGEKKRETLEKIKIDIETLRSSIIDYPREQGDRLLERLEG